ncbi:MAG: hypothetical protein RR630_02015 [Coprobacillus sp.]
MEKLLYGETLQIEWKELDKTLEQTFDEFIKQSLLCADLSNNSNVQKLINKKNLEKFRSLIYLLQKDLSVIDLYEIGVFDSIEEMGERMKLWIVLGSLVEMTMQIFLSVYLYDYQISNWLQWEEFGIGKTDKLLTELIDELLIKGIINKNVSKSLKKSLKETIKKHTEVKEIDKIMLDELIQFFDKMKIIESEEKEQLQIIQRNRNCIHAYSEREINSWKYLKESIYFFLYLLKKIINRFPDTSYIYDRF